MCNFFSFVTKGDGKPIYFDLKTIKELEKDNPEDYNFNSHSSIVHKFISENPLIDDKVNKYEYIKGELIVDQINTKNDKNKVEKWIEHFAKSEEFYKLCEKAVENNIWALEFIPDHLKDYKLCEKAVENNSRALEFIPDHLKDYKLCEKAVESNGWALQFVPDHLIDYKLCEKAVENNIWALEFIPDHLKDYKLCDKAVESNFWALEFIPDHLIDYKLCDKAVESNGWALEFVPDHLKNQLKGDK
jgi:hypothetical protein